MLPQNLQPYKL